MFTDAIQTLPARLLRTEVIVIIVALVAVLSGEVDTVAEGIAIGTTVAGYAVSRGIAKQGAAKAGTGDRMVP